MNISTARKLDNYTYVDYARFPEDQRCELIEGQVFMMTPAPSTSHQRVIGNLFIALRGKTQGKKCEAMVAPVDVFLDYAGELEACRTIIQPDVLVVCEPKKISDRGILGPPDLVVEVVSPTSLAHDSHRKAGLYEKYGVPEYWMVLPAEKVVVVYTVKDGEYTPVTYRQAPDNPEPVVVSAVTLPGLTLQLPEIFEEP